MSARASDFGVHGGVIIVNCDADQCSHNATLQYVPCERESVFEDQGFKWHRHVCPVA